MAVEIPVVIDIDQAFKDAAAKVPNAMKPLQQSIQQLQADLEKHRATMEGTSVYSKMFEQAAKKVMQLEEAIDLVNSRMNQFTTRSGSINRLAGDLAVIQKQFERMGSTQMFDATGNLSADAKKLQQDYARVAQELDKVRNILVAEYEAQVKARQEADAQAKAAVEHQRALTMTATTLEQLNTQLAAWRKELANASVGSNAFVNASVQVGILSRKITELNAQTKILGSAPQSIDKLNARLQELNRQYQALDVSDRKGALGQKKLAEYRAISKQLDKEAKDLQKIVDLEKRISDMSHDRARTRQYENAVLNSTANTMHRLSEQQRILSERLERAKFGTKNYDELAKKLEAVRVKMQSIQGTATGVTGALTKQSTVLRNLASYASMYISVFGAMRFIKSIRDVTAELEFQRISLGRLIQDVDYGNALFEKIKKLATVSPFRIKDLVTYTKQLAAYQIEEEKLYDTTKRLADISAGLGVDMNRLILAYGQVRAASVLRGQELRQFTEAGIPLVDLLAEKMGELNKQSYTTADVFKLISARAVPFSAIAEIFEDLTDKGGMFYKMQEEQAKTLKGRWEKLKDVYDIALQSIGESKGLLSFTTYNDIILKGLTELANGLRVIPKLLEGGSLAWIAYSIAVTKSRNAVRAKRIEDIKATFAVEATNMAHLKGVKHVDAYTAALIRQKAATTMLGRAFYGLKAAIIANPWGAAIAAVLGIVTALISFRKNTDKATTDVTQFKEAVEGLVEIDKKYTKNEKLINTYEELASKTERTDAENKRLHSTMSKLSDLFPTLSSQIDDETKSLKENVDALRDKNEEQRQMAIEETKQRLNAARVTRDEKKRELKELEEERERYALMLEAWQGLNLPEDKSVQRGIASITESFNEFDEKVQKTRGDIESLNESIEAFENFLNPKPVDEATKAWKDLVKERNDYQTSLGKVPLFTPQEIDDLEDVYDLYKKLKTIWKESKESAEGLHEAYVKATEPITKGQLYKEWQDEEAKFKQSDLLRGFFGFDFKSSGGSSGYTQDPFIKRMEDRIKFMQDFKKGYDDLNKYMDKSRAIEKESDIMLTRGMSLGIDAEQQKRAAEDLSNWYDDAIQTAFKEAQKHGAKGTILDFLSQQINDSSNRGKALKDFQKLIQSLWDAKTDIDTSTLKKEIEDALKKVEDEVKRSEIAHNFFQNILDLTGDEDLAATMTMSVYGDVGKDFKGRIQDQLDAALNSLDWGAMDDTTFGNLSLATITQDFQTILGYIDLFPEEWQKVLRQMASDSEKNNADWYTDFMKTFRKAKTYEERINTLQQQKQQKLREMEDKAGVTDADRAAVEAYYAKEIAGVQLEAMKDTYTWTKAFEDLEGVSNQTLNNLINLIDEYVEKYGKDLEPQQLKELARSRENAQQQLISRNAYKATGNAVKDLISASKRYAQLQAEGKENTEEGARAADDQRLAMKRLSDSLNQVYGDMDDVVSKTKDLMSVFASDEDSAYFSEQLDNITKTAKGAGTAALGIAQILTGAITPQAIMQTVTGLADVVSGIFGGVNAKQVHDANKEFEKQAELLTKLDRTYSQLEKSIGEAFGNDTVTRFTEQLKVLQAQYDAYIAQAANREEAAQKESTKKNKKRYEEEAEEAKAQALEVQNSIASLRYETSSKFAGADLASAAESFADAWLEAYQEFGDTSTAIEERMTEMVQNIVKKAALSGIAQSIMGNWYDSLADVKDWNAETIATKWKEAMDLVNPMVEGMQTFANSLQSEGVSLRSTVGQFSGISRDIAGASEESINGLAAGINTQNYYMSFMPLIHENVAQILTYMTGGNTVIPSTESGIEGMPSVQKMIFDHIPNMDANLAELLRVVKSVVSVGNVAPRNYVAAKM